MMLLCPPQGAGPSHFARKKRDELKAHRDRLPFKD
jgi:hypothetical protein